MAGHFVTPYRMAGKRGKNDANDAAAVCEAAGWPQMRFVPVKTENPSSGANPSVHRLGEAYKAERTALINPIRGELPEFDTLRIRRRAAHRLVTIHERTAMARICGVEIRRVESSFV